MAKGKNFDEWAAADGKGCSVCAPPFKATVVAMLEAIIRNGRQGAFGRKDVFEKLKETHPEFKGKERSFEHHLYYHVGDLWAKARGRA